MLTALCANIMVDRTGADPIHKKRRGDSPALKFTIDSADRYRRY